MLYAQAFGAGSGTDAFFVAFRIPNLMRRLFAEGAFSLAFVPVFAQYRAQRSDAEVRALTDNVTGTLGTILFIVTAVGVAAAPLMIYLFAPGFANDTDKYLMTVEMLRITFPYLLFISLTALAGGILNSCGRFALPAFTPVLLNISMITATVWVAPRLERPIMALAWGVFFAGLLQLLAQLPLLKKLKLLPRPRWGWRSEGVQRIIKLMVPTLFGSSVAQINLLFDTLLASFLVTGSVSWLYYSDRLVEFPLGVFGVALGTVILPSLSQKHASASSEAFSHTLDWALRWALLIGTPAMVALAILSGPILTTLFQYGEFTAEDVRMASRSLIAYSFGLLPFMLIKVLAPGFYARQDTRTPVRIGITAMAANMILNLLLIFPLAHAGLALATSLSSTLNAQLLYTRLRREGVYTPHGRWGLFLARLGVANLLMGTVLWLGAGDMAGWLGNDLWGRLRHLSSLIIGGVIVYAVGLLIFGLRPRHLKIATGVQNQPRAPYN
jgi:putative peptidoglycan lipid II flippase